ncbi:Putative ribonuclease H protein At1g65750 [Linum perenne]
MVKVPISGWRDGLDDGSIIGDIVHPLIILVTSAVADFCTGNEEWDVAVVADFCTGNEEWDVAKLSALFPNPILQSVFGMSPPSCDLEGDTLIWGLEPNGKYLVKTGYLLAKGLLENGNTTIWKEIWRWEGPKRVRPNGKQFPWVAYKNWLLTNHERFRRHLMNGPSCGICMGTVKTTENILRECSLMK